MPDDFYFTHLWHVAQIFSLGPPEKFRRIHFRHVERRKLPSRLPCRGLLKNQTLVLVDLQRRFASCMLHRATSSASSLADRTDRSLSATNPTAVSIALRVVNSVQHHNAAFPNSG